LTAYHAAFLTAAGVSLVAAALALTIDDADASVTMVRPRSRRKELRHDSEAPALAHFKPVVKLQD
jgi:hypothetical protein